MKNLRFAKKDVEVTLSAEESTFQDFLQEILVDTNIEEKQYLNNFVKKSKARIHKGEKDKYRKKLIHLKLKNNIPLESRTQGFEKPKSKSR